MLLENKRRNPYASFPVFDSVMWEAVRFQPGLDSYLNTNMDDVVMEDGQIRTVICHQNTTETQLRLSARIFVDATGHGTLGVLAGFACYYIASTTGENPWEIGEFPWHFILLSVILVTSLFQRVAYPLLKIDAASFKTKDWLYVEFIVVDLWLVTWTILLN